MLYDVIGDIHAHYRECVELLIGMDYQRVNAGTDSENFIPPNGRQAFFMGDYINRGPQNKQTITVIRNMVEAGYARAIAGNHDINAVLYRMPKPGSAGEFVRDNDNHNGHQHKTYLHEESHDPEFFASAIKWFRELPLYHKEENYRFVHACWDKAAIRLLTRGHYLDAGGRLTEAGWDALAHKGLPNRSDNEAQARIAIESLIKGPKEKLPCRLSYLDRQGHRRDSGRIAWWRPNACTIGEAFDSLPPNLPFLNDLWPPHGEAPSKTRSKLSDDLRANGKIIFIGHLSLSGQPRLLSEDPNCAVVCTDFGVCYEGKLAAYRMQPGETKPHPENFVWVDSMNVLHHTGARERLCNFDQGVQKVPELIV